MTKERFDPPRDFSLDDFMRHSFKVLHDELYMVKVKISPEWARWVGEKIWHESQKIAKLPDGSLEMTFRVAGVDEIKRWILSLGPEALVLEPEKLKEMVRKERRMRCCMWVCHGQGIILLRLLGIRSMWSQEK